jgi:hypothetical protein
MIVGVTYKAVAITYAKKSHSKSNTNNNKFYLLRRRSIATKELQQNAREAKIVKKRIFFSRVKSNLSISKVMEEISSCHNFGYSLCNLTKC